MAAKRAHGFWRSDSSRAVKFAVVNVKWFNQLIFSHAMFPVPMMKKTGTVSILAVQSIGAKIKTAGMKTAEDVIVSDPAAGFARLRAAMPRILAVPKSAVGIHPAKQKQRPKKKVR